MRAFHLSLLLPLFAGLILAGCDSPAPTLPPRAEAPPLEVRAPARGPAPAVAGNEMKRKQMEFLDRIREADPQARTIDRALLNEQNELGLILDRSVELDKIPALMKSMLTQMAREFPGEDLTVLAYAPSDPPRKIGTARLDAKTRDMSFTAEK